VRIRRRLVLYAIGVATLGMILFAVLLLALAAGGVAGDQHEALTALAADTAAGLERGDGVPAGERPLVVADLATSLDPFIVVTDPAGSIRYATAEIDGRAPTIPAAVIVEALSSGSSSATFSIAPDTEIAVVATSARWPADGTSVVVAGQATRFNRTQLGGLVAFLILAGIITVIVVAIVSWLVIGRALRPLRALTATVDEIRATGDLTRRLPPVRTQDEVGTLTSSFNAMLDMVVGAQDRLAAALGAQRRFVTDASHELRTPLTTIRTNAELLVEHPDVSADDRQDALADIAAEAERMSRLTDDLLVLARTESDATPVRRPVDLAALVEEVAGRAARVAPTGRAVRADAPVAAIVDGDPDLLTRLAWILVDNALRHGEGEVTMTVTGGEPADDTVRLTVTDHGRGIEPAERERVFERFARGDRARSPGGFGLGLPIARSIVDGHGGTIRIEGRAEGGTAVVVEFPAG